MKGSRKTNDYWSLVATFIGGVGQVRTAWERFLRGGETEGNKTTFYGNQGSEKKKKARPNQGDDNCGT